MVIGKCGRGGKRGFMKYLLISKHYMKIVLQIHLNYSEKIKGSSYFLFPQIKSAHLGAGVESAYKAFRSRQQHSLCVLSDGTYLSHRGNSLAYYWGRIYPKLLLNGRKQTNPPQNYLLHSCVPIRQCSQVLIQLYYSEMIISAFTIIIICVNEKNYCLSS